MKIFEIGQRRAVAAKLEPLGLRYFRRSAFDVLNLNVCLAYVGAAHSILKAMKKGRDA